jgi:phage tail-like protein
MDSNLTRHHLLLGQPGWGRCLDGNGDELSVSWNPKRVSGNTSGFDYDTSRETLTLQSRLALFRKASADARLTPANRRGAARDSYGNWYWISDDQSEVLVNNSGDGATTHFWSACDGAKCVREPMLGGFAAVATTNPKPIEQYSGLAVTEDHYLLAGLAKPPGLLVFDLHAGGPPEVMLWPAEVPFMPFDMAAKPKGGVFILDRQNGFLWELDRSLRVTGRDSVILRDAQKELFQPLDGTPLRRRPGRIFPLGVSIANASPLGGSDYVAVEAMPDGTALLLETAAGARFSRVARFVAGRMTGEPVSLESMRDLIEPDNQSAFSLRGHDFAFMQSRQQAEPDCLFVVPEEGDQVYSFSIRLQDDQIFLEPRQEYLPLRLFSGKALVGYGTQAYYDFADRWLPVVAQARPRFVFEATLETPVLDGRDPGCVWHRCTLDACIPPGDLIEVWSTAADDPNRLGVTGWDSEPLPYKRGDGSEEPFSRAESAGLGTWEFLFQSAKGRYAKLRLRFSGDGTSSPRLHALRAYYPRFSYLEHYLPGVYREDQRAAWFLDRLLANFEGLFTSLEDKVALARMLFDTRSSPNEFLDWLASWFGVALDPAWDETRRRLFLAHAMELFQYRGTPLGLVVALRLALDPCPTAAIFDLNSQLGDKQGFRTIERFRTRRMPPVLLGDASATLAPQPGRAWTPEQGGAELNRRWTAGGGSGVFPSSPPATATAAWQQFSTRELGFVPAGSEALALWQAFLSRRYRRIAAYNAAYGAALASFESPPWPVALPRDGAPLRDWYDFHVVVLATLSNAHRFTVLVPVSPGADPNSAAEQKRRELALRVVELEKPAHTACEVKYYWALFRTGSARLGDDTVLGQGSRDPRLMRPGVLGQAFAGESYLAAGHPRSVRNRVVLDQGNCSSQKENA